MDIPAGHSNPSIFTIPLSGFLVVLLQVKPQQSYLRLSYRNLFIPVLGKQYEKGWKVVSSNLSAFSLILASSRTESFSFKLISL